MNPARDQQWYATNCWSVAAIEIRGNCHLCLNNPRKYANGNENAGFGPMRARRPRSQSRPDAPYASLGATGRMLDRTLVAAPIIEETSLKLAGTINVLPSLAKLPKRSR